MFGPTGGTWPDRLQCSSASSPAAVVIAVHSLPAAVNWVAIAALALAVLWLVGRYIRWASTSLIVTTSRLIRRTGVLSRSGREIPLAALTDISYHQRLLQRIIGAGDLLLESAGRQGQEVFPDLPGPARIQQVIATQVDRSPAQRGSRGSAPGSLVDTGPDRGARRAAPAGASSPTPSSRPRKPSCSIGCDRDRPAS